MGPKVRFGRGHRGPSAESFSWIGGLHAVEETLRSRPGEVRELWLDREKQSAFAGFVELARAAGIKVRFVKRRDLDRAAPGRHQGAAVKARRAGGEGLDSILSLPEESKKGMVLVALDRIQDPHNLGAIARSAANFGASGLIIPERHSAPVTPAAVQVSAGALQKLTVFPVGSLAQALERCRDAGFWIYGADAAGDLLWKVVLNTPLVLVIGSEGEGLRPLVKETCDALAAIPQSSKGVESLNASCAASVLLYEIARQRSLGG